MNKIPIKPAILITDRNGRILFADPLSYELFADTGRMLPGQDFRLLISGGLADLELGVMATMPGLTVLPVTRRHLSCQLMITEMGAEPDVFFVVQVYAAMHSVSSETKDGARADLLAQVVATLEQAKDEVQTSRLREKEVSRLKTRFISLASHEFRSPLSAIQLSVALIERYYERLERDKVFFHLRKIRMAIGDLTGILEDLLSLERIDAGKLETHIEAIDLPVFCRELLLEMQLQTKQGQQLVFAHQGTCDHFQLDRKVLRHCLINLLSNAIKYSAENSLIRLSIRVSNESCDFNLADEGLGIPAEDQQHIFEPFFRAGNVIDQQGTGLGLSIVRRYCELMNGKVSFESRENQGTVFTLWFPASCRPATHG